MAVKKELVKIYKETVALMKNSEQFFAKDGMEVYRSWVGYAVA